MTPTVQRFVVVEGLDGTGTTTVASMLADRLDAADQRVRLTAEPTDGPFGRLLRRHIAGEETLDPVTTALVFTADRADHLDRVIRPALRSGRWVISDRYLLSTLAYQGADGVDPHAILAASSSFEVPGVTFVLDVPEDVRRSRLADRRRVERWEGAEDADRLRASYARATELLRGAGHRIEFIDATPPADDVRDEIWARLDAEA